MLIISVFARGIIMSISDKDMIEIKERDFLKNVDHYHDFDNIRTNLIYGTPNSNRVFLSIIVPIYDHPYELIFRAINSVFNQEFDYSIHVIIIDDYTQSDRNNIVLEYIKSLQDSRITYYKNEKNLGVFANWNRGIQFANSHWITILHTDDFFKNNFLSNMKRIIDTHPEIDQLCCNYKLLRLKDENININDEYQGTNVKTIVRKVKYTEYFYEMKTSVKGALYKRDKLIEIGGFRNQGDGIGLDDYPLMLRYAYYYNTYLIESVLYLDSWGYNDSLNTKHWFPELVENYYMWIYFANYIGGIRRKIYRANAKYLLRKRAIEYDNGTSWVGIPVPIDMDLLQQYCNVDFSSCTKLGGIIFSYLARIINILYKYPLKKFEVELMSGNNTKELE